MIRRQLSLVFGAVMLTLAGCGEKIPLPSLDVDDAGGNLTDTTYVAVLPHWTEAGGLPFFHPSGIAVGYDRSIYVCDTENDRIVRLDPTGGFIESYGISKPTGVAMDRGFNLVAVNDSPILWGRGRTDSAFQEIYELDSVYLCAVFCRWHFPTFDGVAASLRTDKRIYVIGGNIVRAFFFGLPLPYEDVIDSGSAYGQLYNPTGIAFGGTLQSPRLIVAQYGWQNGVQYFTPPSHREYLPETGTDAVNGTLTDTKTVAVDDQGNVFVLHRSLSTVMMFNKRGEYVLSFGRFGSDSLGLYHPAGIAVFDDIVLIADLRNNRIARYQMTAVPQN